MSEKPGFFRGLIHQLNHPLLPLIVVALLYFFFLATYLRTHDAAFFVQAGEYFVDTAQTPSNLFTVTPNTGYDGTFYYRLAITPFTREQTAFGVTIDTPRYRHQRILYPLLAWFFSFRSPPLVIYSLILVNFLALCALGWVGGHYAQTIERHALWGALFALYPGFVYTLSRNLTEIVEALFVLAALVALRQRRTALAAGLLILAILGKETAVLIPAAILVVTAVAFWQKRETNQWWASTTSWWASTTSWWASTTNWWAGLIPLIAYGLWQLWLNFWWQDALAQPFRLNLGLPFVGIIQGFYAAATIGGSQVKWAIEVGFLLILAIGVFFSLRNGNATPTERLVWALSLALLLPLSVQIWLEGQGYLRAASLFYLFSLIILLNAKNKVANGLLITAALAWGFMIAHHL